MGEIFDFSAEKEKREKQEKSGEVNFVLIPNPMLGQEYVGKYFVNQDQDGFRLTIVDGPGIERISEPLTKERLDRLEEKMRKSGAQRTIFRG